jgi:hypothetical protein
MIKGVNNDSVHDYDEVSHTESRMVDIDMKIQRSFDKSIIALEWQ